MKDTDIELMREMEGKYWWHVSRRFILQSILKRYLFPERLPIRLLTDRKVTFRHAGSAYSPSFWGASEATPESYIQTHPESNTRSWTSQDDDVRKSSSILDVGCGSGINMQWLKNFGKVTGVDNSSKAIEFCQQYGKTISADATKLPLQNNNFCLITAFDVLEHLKDDELAIKEWGRVLQPGGYLFISVPAHQWLFSNRDTALKHYRRYNLQNLQKLLRQNNLEPVFSSHIFALVFPLFVLQRIFLQKASSSVYPQLPKLLNDFLEWVSNSEVPLLKFMRLPFGGSIVILARKKG